MGTKTKYKIINVASNLFISKSYKNVSLNNIAKKAGVTKGGVYHYFSSKEELFLVVFEYTLSSAEKNICAFISSDIPLSELLKSALTPKNAIDQIFDMLKGKQSYIEPNYIAFMFDALKNFPKLKSRVTKYYQTIAKAIRDKLVIAKKNEELNKTLDLDALAAQIIFMIEGSNLLSLFNSELLEVNSDMYKQFLKTINK
jgi:AcrR family transcriptional regulator